MCLAREMLGDQADVAVLEMNASDARGIDVVRNRIKSFAQQKVTLPPGRHKIIILVNIAATMLHHLALCSCSECSIWD
jgi:replication factor C subunit 2/4